MTNDSDNKISAMFIWTIAIMILISASATERGCEHNEVMERLDSIEQSIDSTRHTK